MKLYRYLMTLATLLLVACSQDDGIPTPQYENVDIQASIVYGSMTGGFTRSNPLDESTTFSNNDVIVVTTDGQEPTEYTFSGSSWEPEVNNPLKWKQESMTFTAWYPATEGTSATNFTLPKTLSENNIAQWDYMTATAENATRENGVNLEFERKMALVVIEEAEVDEVFGYAAITNIVLHANSSGYKDGVVNTESGGNITMLFADNKYYAIVSPTTKDDTETFLTVTLSNNETAIVKGIPALTAGNKYTYSLNVGREAVATSVSVDEWTSSTDNPLSLEGGLSYTISADGGTYTVYRAHGLMAWNTAVQNNNALNLTLGDDIDMQDVEGWQQVSDYIGTIKGNGFTVSGLNMDLSSSGNAGFVAKLGTNGKIVNLNLEGLVVTGSATNVGGLVGENNGGTVGACSVTGAVTASSATGSVGGLVGLNSSGLVLSSYNTGTVSGNANIGSVVGKNMSDVTGCYYTGSSTGIGSGGGDATLVDNKNVFWTGEQNSGKTNEIAVIIMNQLMKEWAADNLDSKGWVQGEESRPILIGNADFTKVIDHVIVNSDTYKVYTAKGLIAWNTSKSENYLQSNLKVMDNIDLSQQSYTWKTHGYGGTGEYDKVVEGNGKIIKGLKINGDDGFTGFIGTLGDKGRIVNLHLRDVNISINGYSYVGGITGSCEGVIIGCSVSGNISTNTNDAGGIAGNVHDNGKIIACYNMATVSSRSQANYGSGGITGRHSGLSIISCYNVGKVLNNYSYYQSGAIVGCFEGDTPEVLSCYWKSVTGEKIYGGFGSDKGSGNKKKEAEQIINDNWLSAITSMNNAIAVYNNSVTDANLKCYYKYEQNGSSTTEPLKLIKTGN